MRPLPYRRLFLAVATLSGTFASFACNTTKSSSEAKEFPHQSPPVDRDDPTQRGVQMPTPVPGGDLPKTPIAFEGSPKIVVTEKHKIFLTPLNPSLKKSTTLGSALNVCLD